MTGLPWVYDDGGREAAGFVGTTGDCVTRAFAIALARPYREVYDELHAAIREDGAKRWAKAQRSVPAWRDAPAPASYRGSPRDGVAKELCRDYLAAAGWLWTPQMSIGSGCRVHVARGEVPARGRFVLQLSKHVSAVVDGRVRDTYDPGRDGTRCVYGWWTAP